MMWWKRLRTWKKGALIGLIIGALVIPIIINVYESTRESYNQCVREKNNEETCNDLRNTQQILKPFRDFYVELYLGIFYYYFGLAFLAHIFGESSLLTKIIVIFCYSLSFSFIGALIGLIFYKKRRNSSGYD